MAEAIVGTAQAGHWTGSCCFVQVLSGAGNAVLVGTPGKQNKNFDNCIMYINTF